MRIRANILWVVAVGAIGAIATWFFARTSKPLDVQLATVSEQRIETSFTADGEVKGAMVHVAPRVIARIASIEVQEGDAVRPGQVLVRLADPDSPAAVDSALAAVQSSVSAHRQAGEAVRAAEAKVNAAIRTAQAQVNAAKARLAQAKAGNRPQEIEVARHRAEAARASYDEAQKAAARARRLFEEGAVSRAAYEAAATREALAKQDLESALDALDLARAGPTPESVATSEMELEVARRALNQAQTERREVDVLRSAAAVAWSRVLEAQSALKRAQAGMQELTLTSPTVGVVAKRALEPGDLATPGLPILTLVDDRRKYIEGEASDEDIGKAQVGDEVSVSAAAYPGRTFPATITHLAAAAELKPDVSIRTRIVRFRVQLKGSDAGFRVGMEVDIEGRHRSERPVLSVPTDALAFAGNETAVWVVREGKVRLTPIKVGVITPTVAEALSGLKAGDRVVVSGKEALTDGAAVRERDK